MSPRDDDPPAPPVLLRRPDVQEGEPGRALRLVHDVAAAHDLDVLVQVRDEERLGLLHRLAGEGEGPAAVLQLLVVVLVEQLLLVLPRVDPAGQATAETEKILAGNKNKEILI